MRTARASRSSTCECSFPYPPVLAYLTPPNSSQAFRTILFDTENFLGRNAAIIVAWIILSACTTVVFTWLVRALARRREKRALARGAKGKGKGKAELGDAEKAPSLKASSVKASSVKPSSVKALSVKEKETHKASSVKGIAKGKRKGEAMASAESLKGSGAPPSVGRSPAGSIKSDKSGVVVAERRVP